MASGIRQTEYQASPPIARHSAADVQTVSDVVGNILFDFPPVSSNQSPHSMTITAETADLYGDRVSDSQQSIGEVEVDRCLDELAQCDQSPTPSTQVTRIFGAEQTVRANPASVGQESRGRDVAQPLIIPSPDVSQARGTHLPAPPSIAPTKRKSGEGIDVQMLTSGKPPSLLLASKVQSKHKGKKPHICEVRECGKSFPWPSSLKRHSLVHTGEKPFSCKFEGCSKSFIQTGDLKRHSLVHTGEKPFHCPEEGCSKSFARAGILKRHSLVHTGEKPFSCKFEGCSKSFIQTGDLKRHTRTHTGERPFHCPEEGCDKSFAVISNLKAHRRVHTGERPFHCLEEGCSKSFTQSGQLKRHVRTHQDKE